MLATIQIADFIKQQPVDATVSVETLRRVSRSIMRHLNNFSLLLTGNTEAHALERHVANHTFIAQIQNNH